MRRAVFKYLFSADAVPSLNSSCILLCICQTCADILQKLFQAENTAKKFLLLVSGIRRKCPFGRFHQAADHSGECLSSVFCDLQVLFAVVLFAAHTCGQAALLRVIDQLRQLLLGDIELARQISQSEHALIGLI